MQWLSSILSIVCKDVTSLSFSVSSSIALQLTHGTAYPQGFDTPRRPSQSGGDIETGSPPPPPPVNEEKDRYMDEFFKEVSSIKVSTTRNTSRLCC